MRLVSQTILAENRGEPLSAVSRLRRAMAVVLALCLCGFGFHRPAVAADTGPPPGTTVEVSASGRSERLDEDPLLYLWKESFAESVSATETANGLQGSISGEQYQEVSYPANSFHEAACSSYDRITFSQVPLKASLSSNGDGSWELTVSNVFLGPAAIAQEAPDCEYANYAPVDAATTMTRIGGTFRLEDSDPDPARFAAVSTFTGPEYNVGWDSFSITVSVDSAPIATPEPRSGKCKKASTKTFKYKTYTDIPGPDPHWYTTTITVDRCRKKGKDYITGTRAKRHVEKGFIPRMLGLVGWSSRTDSPADYSPSKIPKGGTKSASVRLQYTACFDLTKLLDKAGLKTYAKKKMKKPLRKSIKKILKKAKIDKINPQVRKSIANSWNRKVDHVFRKGTVSTYLRDKYRIPKSIGKHVEKVALPQLAKVKRFLKNEVQHALSTGRYDGMTATVASEAILDGGYRVIDHLVTFCGGRPSSESLLTTWDVSFDIAGGGKKIKVTPDSYYIHPLMKVRKS